MRNVVILFAVCFAVLGCNPDPSGPPDAGTTGTVATTGSSHPGDQCPATESGCTRLTTGAFTMGCQSGTCTNPELPPHTVTLTEYRIGPIKTVLGVPDEQTFDTAVSKCQQLGGHLPTKAQLERAYKSGAEDVPDRLEWASDFYNETQYFQDTFGVTDPQGPPAEVNGQYHTVRSANVAPGLPPPNIETARRGSTRSEHHAYRCAY
jgi:hypothetical protein